MKSEFAFINSEQWRSWQRILGTNAAFASTFAAVGGPQAAIPFALNLIKEGVSRLLAEYDFIETKYEHIAAELITSAVVIAVAAVALTVFTPMTASTVFYSAVPMVVETLVALLSTAETITDSEQRRRYEDQCSGGFSK